MVFTSILSDRSHCAKLRVTTSDSGAHNPTHPPTHPPINTLTHTYTTHTQPTHNPPGTEGALIDALELRLEPCIAGLEVGSKEGGGLEHEHSRG